MDLARALARSASEPQEARLEPSRTSPDAPDVPEESGVQRRDDVGRISLREVVGTYHTFVWRSLRRLGVYEANIDDAVQNVFLTIARRLDEVTPEKLRSFVFGVAVRVAANERRSQRRRGYGEPLEDHAIVDGAPSHEAALDTKRARALLDQVLDALPDDLRTVFVLHEFESLTAVEISECVGIPVGTVASRLRRARETLEAEIHRVRARMAFCGAGGAR